MVFDTGFGDVELQQFASRGMEAGAPACAKSGSDSAAARPWRRRVRGKREVMFACFPCC
jgi:hypothetical protein